jgi:L-amino acid N-acyltransferase YncA
MISEPNISVKPNVTRPEIAELKTSDWGQVRAIYLEGIATCNATFETEAPSWEAWDAAHLQYARLVARRDETIIGWAALSRVSQRCVYGGVAEVSILVSQTRRASGVGRKLLEALIAESERNGIWTLQAGMFPENAASRALHERFGFREVGRRERIGKLNGVWRDTILFERRSSIIGVS